MSLDRSETGALTAVRFLRDDPYVIPDKQQHGDEDTRAREKDGEPVEPGLGGENHRFSVGRVGLLYEVA